MTLKLAIEICKPTQAVDVAYQFLFVLLGLTPTEFKKGGTRMFCFGICACIVRVAHWVTLEKGKCSFGTFLGGFGSIDSDGLWLSEASWGKTVQLGILDRRCHEYLKTLQPLNEGQIFGATNEYLFRRTHLTSLDQYMLGPCCLKLWFIIYNRIEDCKKQTKAQHNCHMFNLGIPQFWENLGESLLWTLLTWIHH